MSSFRSLILVALALTATGVVLAFDDATVRFARVEGAGFSARDVQGQLEITDKGMRLRARIGELMLQAAGQTIRDVNIDCGDVQLSDVRIACADALIAAEFPMLGRQRLRASVDYGRVDGSLRVALRDLRIGGGSATARVALVGERWSATVDLQRAALEPLLKMAREANVGLPSISGTGLASLQIDANGGNAAAFTVSTVRVSGAVRELTANNDSGTLASDKLDLAINAALRREGGDWHIDANVTSAAGQAYFEPVFLDFGAHAIALEARGVWTRAGVLELEHFDINHADVLAAAGSVTLQMAAEQPVRELRLNLRKLQFPGAYASYLQPYLVNTSFKSITSSGALHGEATVTDGVPQSAQVSFDALTLDDGTRSFAIRELNGALHWSDEEQGADVQPSHLHFAGGTLLGLELGGSELELALNARNVRLLEAAHIPVFDGAIELESFRVRNLASPQVAFMVDATIQPISVSQLCRAFGWPEFGGQIGGKISKLRLREGVVTLGTTLAAQVFDGLVSLSNLRLEDALGQWPRFQADIELSKLDLALVTQAFSFGRITGRLSGSVRDLHLFNWTPVSFDASLYTPPDDRSRHRISQRAVANIGNLGGGGASVTAALSSGFLKFFEEFNYDRLGLSCRLANEICYMNGVAPAPNNGYYLVKGKGLPRIDVIAGARRVDWPRMVAQLKAATESSGPTVR
ncbi:MAG: hypothetical protein ABW110_06190 [Steroidobacteraceae bacterium]